MVCRSINLFNGVHGPCGNITDVDWSVLPRVGLLRHRAPGVEGCAHLFRVEGERVLADLTSSGIATILKV